MALASSGVTNVLSRIYDACLFNRFGLNAQLVGKQALERHVFAHLSVPPSWPLFSHMDGLMPAFRAYNSSFHPRYAAACNKHAFLFRGRHLELCIRRGLSRGDCAAETSCNIDLGETCVASYTLITSFS
jgi:hypothetical protein